jgi:hypothetical protein
MANTEYIKWLQENHVRFNGIEAGFVSEGWRGVLATKDIQPGGDEANHGMNRGQSTACTLYTGSVDVGELILGVPERLLISVQSACRSQQLQEALSKLGSNLTSEQVP